MQHRVVTDYSNVKGNETVKVFVRLRPPEDGSNVSKQHIKDLDKNTDNDTNTNPMDAKLRIIEDEIKIIEDSNIKFKEENENLKNEIITLGNEISNFENKVESQKKIIEKFDIDKEELNFLRLNLEYGHKCRKSFFNSKGFSVGTTEYKNCVLRKGLSN